MFKTKAESVADSINHLLYTLVLRCVWGQQVLDRFHVGVDEVPVVLCRGGHVLKNPSIELLASAVRYRVGLSFTDPDKKILEVFCNRHGQA